MAAVTEGGLARVMDAVRTVAEAQIAPAAADVDRSGRFPEDGVNALAEAGALGLLVPTEHGGSGGGLQALVEACEVVGVGVRVDRDGLPHARGRGRDGRGRRR